VDQIGPYKSSFGIENHGLSGVSTVHWNQAAPQLYEAGLRRGEGVLSIDGAFVTETGEYTGRSPKDKFMVQDPSIEKDIWWGPVNQPIGADKFEIVHGRMMDYLRGKEVFVQDCYAGADPAYRLPVRIITENAWHSLFARNMFIVPPVDAAAGFKPEWTVIQAPNFHSVPKTDGTKSEDTNLVSITSKKVLIGGSPYNGEIKKSIIGVMN